MVPLGAAEIIIFLPDAQAKISVTKELQWGLITVLNFQ